MNNKLTIYDIAKEAGVSITTVSRVLNNKCGIKESTRIKVKDILDKHNYVPSIAARGLANKSMNTVAVLMVDIRDIHYSYTAHAIEQELSTMGYGCILCSTGMNKEAKIRYIQTMSQRQIDGVIFIGSIFQNSTIKNAILKYLKDIPVVIVNGYLPLENICGVLCDDTSGILNSVNYLYEKGHRDIAYVFDSNTPSSKLKKEGYILGMTQKGLADKIIIQKTENTLEGGALAIKQLLAKNHKYTSIIFGEDITAIGGMKALISEGYSIPEDIAIIGFNNSKYTTICTPTLTSVDNKLGEMGKQAARVLCDKSQGMPTVSKTILIPELKERESSR